jgi:hypothetical protein
MLPRFASLLLALAILAAIVLTNQGNEMQRIDTLKIATGYVLLFVILLLGVQVAFDIAAGRIELKYLIADAEGDASMGRFQLLVFTFVIALSFFLVVLEKKEIPDIPGQVLTLLGISASTFAVSKSVDASTKQNADGEPNPPPPQPPKPE